MDKGVGGQADPDDRSEQDEKPFCQMTLSKHIFETVHAAPHCADRVDDEVDCQWGGDDDRYRQGVESCQFMSEDRDAGGEEERVNGENL